MVDAMRAKLILAPVADRVPLLIGRLPPMRTYLDFEKPIAELESRIEDLRKMDGQTGVQVGDEIEKLQTKADHLLADAYSKLTRWQKAQVARHSSRPHFSNYGMYISAYRDFRG